MVQSRLFKTHSSGLPVSLWLLVSTSSSSILFHLKSPTMTAGIRDLNLLFFILTLYLLTFIPRSESTALPPNHPDDGRLQEPTASRRSADPACKQCWWYSGSPSWVASGDMAARKDSENIEAQPGVCCISGTWSSAKCKERQRKEKQHKRHQKNPNEEQITRSCCNRLLLALLAL